MLNWNNLPEVTLMMQPNHEGNKDEIEHFQIVPGHGSELCLVFCNNAESLTHDQESLKNK